MPVKVSRRFKRAAPPPPPRRSGAIAVRRPAAGAGASAALARIRERANANAAALSAAGGVVAGTVLARYLSEYRAEVAGVDARYIGAGAGALGGLYLMRRAKSRTAGLLVLVASGIVAAATWSQRSEPGAGAPGLLTGPAPNWTAPNWTAPASAEQAPAWSRA